ncbi:lipase member K-like [Ixodes scapularis]
MAPSSNCQAFFHEHAVYDVPAQIDYVLNATKRNNLIYVGYSQGTLVFFTMMSEKPEYNDKVKAFAGLTPFNKLAHMKVPPLALFAPHAEPLLLGQSEIGVLAPPQPLQKEQASLRFEYYVRTRLPLYLCFAPSGTSMKNIIHLDQMVKSKKPQKFDYGVEMNRVLYGQRRPPLYNLSNVKTDVGAFWSEGDEFVAPQDVRDLVRDLGPRVKKNNYIDDVQYTHAHFIVGTVNSAYLNKDLLEFLGRYRAPGP